MLSVLQFAAPGWLAVVSPRLWIALGIILLGVGLGYLTVLLGRRLLYRFGIDDAVEGTAVERAAGEYGTSTVGFITKLAGYFVIVLSVITAGTFTNIQFADLFLRAAAVFLRRRVDRLHRDRNTGTACLRSGWRLPPAHRTIQHRRRGCRCRSTRDRPRDRPLRNADRHRR